MYLGIDLGGTNIAIGLVDEKGNIIVQDSTPTLGTRTADEIIDDMIALAEKIVADANLSKSDIKAIGIGCPGAVDNQKGTIVFTENVPFSNFPIFDKFKKHFDAPVYLENDANAAAYGEYVVNGEGKNIFVAVTLGTGIGGGIIIDGKIFKGSNGVGAEIGHTPLVLGGVRCSCGQKGCWEAYASVTALINQTKIAIGEHPESLMNTLFKERKVVNGRTAFDAAKQGDKVALEVVNKYIEYIAGGLVGIVNIFQPDKVVIGGGISKEGAYLIDPIIDYVRKYDYNQFFEPVKIEPATLYNDAGIIGAAFAAKNFL
ncbi:MAG: ROK family glucokinase [Clostridia bacterium]|nr:ROK family glucokinase [Clostridia bacterium]